MLRIGEYHGYFIYIGDSNVRVGMNAVNELRIGQYRAYPIYLRLKRKG